MFLCEDLKWVLGVFLFLVLFFCWGGLNFVGFAIFIVKLMFIAVNN